MIETVLIVVTALVGLLLLGALAQAAGFALGMSALAGMGLFRYYGGLWRATKSRGERIALGLLTVLVVIGALSAVDDLVTMLF